jgi:hypothetical protein
MPNRYIARFVAYATPSMRHTRAMIGPLWSLLHLRSDRSPTPLAGISAAHSFPPYERAEWPDP